jgi:hypothetical protein
VNSLAVRVKDTLDSPDRCTVPLDIRMTIEASPDVRGFLGLDTNSCLNRAPFSLAHGGIHVNARLICDGCSAPGQNYAVVELWDISAQNTPDTHYSFVTRVNKQPIGASSEFTDPNAAAKDVCTEIGYKQTAVLASVH